MSALLAPAFTGTLNDKPLRFFKAPLPGPHLPWHATDDLVACLALPRGLARARTKIGLANLAYNIRRLVFLRRPPASAAA